MVAAVGEVQGWRVGNGGWIKDGELKLQHFTKHSECGRTTEFALPGGWRNCVGY